MISRISAVSSVIFVSSLICRLSLSTFHFGPCHHLDRVAQEILDRTRRNASVSASCRQVGRYARHAGELRTVPDGDVPGDPGLAADQNTVAHLRAARDTDARDDTAMPADFHIVADHHI